MVVGTWGYVSLKMWFLGGHWALDSIHQGMSTACLLAGTSCFMVLATAWIPVVEGVPRLSPPLDHRGVLLSASHGRDEPICAMLRWQGPTEGLVICSLVV